MENKTKKESDVWSSVIYLCSCSCCSKVRVSLQKSWQLAGLLAMTLAFGAEERVGLMTVFSIINHGINSYKLFHYCCIMAQLTSFKFPNDITECYTVQPFGFRKEDRSVLGIT